ncbi:MAG: amino acid permease [Verrucomicrobiae bacterium]|nr:amino acid permease [Verrucomicrobiae bacterium]
MRLSASSSAFVIRRPRNLDWKRAAAILYGDWGTSKAYVLGLAFVAAGFSSLPIILAICALTAIVAISYGIICAHFPDGGGVYSSARTQSRILAVVGALLLVADLTVTAALSAWTGLSYLGLEARFVPWVAMLSVVALGTINLAGPKHSGSLAAVLAIPTVVVVLLLALFSFPHLTLAHLQPPKAGFSHNWVAFVGMILALSGVETIANLTGVMKTDARSTADRPSVRRTSRFAIALIAIEVVLGTALLGWAMLSLPSSLSGELLARKEDMLRFLGEQYGALAFGNRFGVGFGVVVGLVVGLLLISAVNTSVVALIGLFYMMARDEEMPRAFTRLNRHGVPWLPLLVAMALPVVVLLCVRDFESLAGLYAIGVVGAITVNTGSCAFNRKLNLPWAERSLMIFTFLVLFAVELTIAKTKPDALFFACCILGAGLAVRAWAQKRAGLATMIVSREVVEPSVGNLAALEPRFHEGQRILVAIRGLNPVLRYALEEARLRKSPLYILYVREIAVSFGAQPSVDAASDWREDPHAAAIMCGALDLAKKAEVAAVPLYAVSDNPPATIVDLAATLGIDLLMLGASHRRFLTKLLKGNVAEGVVRNLPENIQLVIHG